MAQMALEQAVSEITDYLKEIDAKLDDLLRDQKDQTVSKLAGISHMIDETMLIYQQVGSISATTWSKVSGCPQDIATLQAYAIAKIKSLTEKAEREQDPKQVRPLTQQIRQEIHQWLGMLASAVKMQDQVSCIELARVCQEEPEQLEAYKKGIVLARNKRLEEIEQSLNALGKQLEEKAKTVGGQVLLNPYSSPHAIANIESITSDLNAFASTLQLEHIHLHVEDGPTWIEAAGKAVDDTGKALQNARQQTAHAVQDVGNAIAKGAQAPVPPLPRECRTPKTRPRTSRRMRATPLRKVLRTQRRDSRRSAAVWQRNSRRIETAPGDQTTQVRVGQEINRRVTP